jgi:hypothetical protein
MSLLLQIALEEILGQAINSLENSQLNSDFTVFAGTHLENGIMLCGSDGNNFFYLFLSFWCAMHYKPLTSLQNKMNTQYCNERQSEVDRPAF